MATQVVDEIQSQFLNDLFASFLSAFVLIAAIFTVVQAGLWSGLLSMVPNVFPALTMFGILGWANQSIEIGSIMTVSVAMGIAVDDTLNFLDDGGAPGIGVDWGPTGLASNLAQPHRACL